MGRCATSHGNKVYCYVELAISSLVVALTAVTTHCTYRYPWRDGQAELAWVAVNDYPS